MYTRREKWRIQYDGKESEEKDMIEEKSILEEYLEEESLIEEESELESQQQKKRWEWRRKFTRTGNWIRKFIKKESIQGLDEKERIPREESV